MPKRVLVTGATGTVGSAVVERIARDPSYEVHAVVRKPVRLPSAVCQRLVDLQDCRFPGLLADTEYDAIVHAAQPRDWSDDRLDTELFDIKVIHGLESLCSAHTRLIYTGGVWVYGHQRDGVVITESSPLRPAVYARARVKAIEYLREKSPKCWVQVMLPSLVYGSVGPLLGLCDGLRRQSVTVADDTSILWSLIERTDVGEAYYLLLEREYSEREYVLAEPEPLPVVSVYSIVAAELGVSFRPVSRHQASLQVGANDMEVMMMSQPVSAGLFFGRMGWYPKHRFASSVSHLISGLNYR